MPALRPTQKSSVIARYNTSTGRWTNVRSIASPGIYEIMGG
jgi:hypothetical protein